MEALFKQMEDFAKENKVPIINENGRKVFIEIIKKYKPQRVLEIGTAIGYSALLTTYYGAENAKIISLELDEERAKQAQDFINQSAAFVRAIWAGRLSVCFLRRIRSIFFQNFCSDSRALRGEFGG